MPTDKQCRCEPPPVLFGGEAISLSTKQYLVLGDCFVGESALLATTYPKLIADRLTRLQRDRMMELFGSRADFIRIHQEIQPLVDLEDED